MNVGDKVRIIHGREEGIITRIIDGKLIEVEIEDGFLIPVLQKEVVVIDSAEKQYFNNPTAASSSTDIIAPTSSKKSSGKIGVYLAYKPLNDQDYSLYLLNTSENTVLYSICENNAGTYQPLNMGTLATNEAIKVRQLSAKNFEKWLPVVVRILEHPMASSQKLGALYHAEYKPKAASFYRNKQLSPILDTQAHLIKLEPKPEAVSTQALHDQLNNSGKANANSNNIIEPTSAEVDLHIEKLNENYSSLSAGEILVQQIAAFEDHLTRALATNQEQIIFIHGVGNGKLKNEIHKKLSKSPDIAYFKDAQKEKFGYGATLVKLKL